MRLWLPSVLILLLSHLGAQQPGREPPMVLRDRFGRDLAERGVTLLDWEGHIANPAIPLRIELNPRVNLPARIVLKANGCRLMFDLFSEVGPDGPSKTLLFGKDARTADFLMSVFPDHAGGDEEYLLEAELTTGVGERRVQRWPLHVHDQDRPGSGGYTVTVDYRHDRTGFFKDARARRILETAVSDWTYFLDDQGFSPVPARSETAFVHEPTTFARGWPVVNEEPYAGFLLFAQGIRGDEKRSGGRASDTGGLQERSGQPTGLRRSGTVISEVTGNWNGLGWSMEESDDRWWVSSCHAREPHDYYSVVRHEIGHCLLYHKVHPAFARLIRNGRIRNPLVEQYLHGAPRINASEHLFETVDPVSRVGAFGNEYGGDMPRKRWLITKVDLLMLAAAGYRVRSVTPLQELTVPPTQRITLVPGRPAMAHITASGGIPDYRYRIVGGALPPGVALDDFTGALSGTPSRTGLYHCVIEVTDQDARSRPRPSKLTVEVRTAAGGP